MVSASCLGDGDEALTRSRQKNRSPRWSGAAGIAGQCGVAAVDRPEHLNRSVRLDHDFSLVIRQPVVPRTSGSIVSTAAQITHA